MAQVSFITGGTGYVNAVDTQTISVTGASFTWTPPTFTTYFYTAYAGSGQRELEQAFISIPMASGSTYTKNLTSNRSTTTGNGSWSGDVSFQTGTQTFTTSTYFSSSNPTVRTITALLAVRSGIKLKCYSGDITYSTSTESQQTLTNVNITLNVPPTFTSTQVSFDTAYVYTGLTHASVTVSDLTAYYGGSITDVTLQIGTATDSRSSNGTLTVLLDTVGTFTPTVTATDSRGQTKTITLDPITVSGYNAPTVTFSADRTTSTGVPDDEGTYATMDCTFTFTDVVADLQAPSVVLTDENGTQTTPTVTWYSSRAADGTLSGSVTWANLSYGDTVYGLAPGLNTNYSYQISVRPRDTQGTGTAIIQTVPSAFYTIDFLAGGHGIAFGAPASAAGFFCNMAASFVDHNNVMRALFDFIHPVGSYYETSDSSFNPNTTWGGTWVLETEGQVHVSAGSNYTIGSTGGEATHVLTTQEMPSHDHSFKEFWDTRIGSGNYSAHIACYSGNTAAGATNIAGGDQAHNNMQPYIVVNRWHRTA